MLVDEHVVRGGTKFLDLSHHGSNLTRLASAAGMWTLTQWGVGCFASNGCKAVETFPDERGSA